MYGTGTESIAKGCEDPEVARRRAAELTAGVFSGPPTYWTIRAKQLLAALLTVSAIAGCEPGSIAAVVLDAPGDSVAHSVRATALHVLLSTRGLARPANPATPATQPKVGGGLAADRDPWVRQAVAGNPTTPPEVLERLADDALARVRDNAAENPNAPGYVRARTRQSAGPDQPEQ